MAIETRTLGANGPAVTLLGLGCNNFGQRIDFEATRAVVNKALDIGITFFDTAESYGDGRSEEFLGRTLGPRRKDVIVATKFGLSGNASRKYIMQAVEGSLRRLGTDCIDYYQLHRPDSRTPIEETLRALDDLVKAGKVKRIGCSYLTGAELDAAQAASAKHGLASFLTCQNEYNLLDRGIERDLVPAMARHGVTLLPYLPLAGGMLTGKYRRDAAMPPGARLSYTGWLAGRYLTPANWRALEGLEKFAADRGHTILDLAFAWLAGRPYVASIIAGATGAAQEEANHRALGWRLAADEMAALDGIRP